MCSRYAVVIAFFLTVCPALVSAEPKAAGEVDHAYLGNYRVSNDRVLGVDAFITEDGRGEKVMLLSDYASGAIRRLVRISETEFVTRSGNKDASAVDVSIRFTKAEDGEVAGLVLQEADGSESFAERVAMKSEEISFEGDAARLAGTLIVPTTEGPHPAIILLHGSAPLTRYSFGPYPHFFTSLGFAVLIYDKRGTGESTGLKGGLTLDRHGAAMSSYAYPEDIAKDALAALRYLQGREDIDATQIGFWGSSEGGMLATYVAARATDAAFAINSSGFMGPLWETLRYQAEIVLRNADITDAAAEKELALIDAWFHLGRTGEGAERFERLRNEIVEADGSWFFQAFGNTPEQARWAWRHLISFDPLPTLATVKCPVLGVFGELDVATDATNASENMHSTLTQAGHKDFSIKIFPNAGHSLMEMPGKTRMAPGVFATLRSWLLERVRFAEAGRAHTAQVRTSQPAS